MELRNGRSRRTGYLGSGLAAPDNIFSCSWVSVCKGHVVVYVKDGWNILQILSKFKFNFNIIF